jgi:hypothetical protein
MTAVGTLAALGHDWEVAGTAIGWVAFNLFVLWASAEDRFRRLDLEPFRIDPLSARRGASLSRGGSSRSWSPLCSDGELRSCSWVASFYTRRPRDAGLHRWRPSSFDHCGARIGSAATSQPRLALVNRPVQRWWRRTRDWLEAFDEYEWPEGIAWPEGSPTQRMPWLVPAYRTLRAAPPPSSRHPTRVAWRDASDDLLGRGGPGQFAG